MINRQIITSTLIIMAAGTYRVLVVKPTPNSKHGLSVTRVLVGGYVLAIIAAIVDLVGGVGAELSSLLLGLAVMTALFAVLPDLFVRFSQRGN